jgi:transcriptional regulator of acetoin/glycerol metabolism
MSEDLVLYAPIEKIDKEKRLVYGFATTEKSDQSDEIVDYIASKKAFAEWPGNIREMHQTKAVGTAVEIIPDDADVENAEIDRWAAKKLADTMREVSLIWLKRAKEEGILQA